MRKRIQDLVQVHTLANKVLFVPDHIIPISTGIKNDLTRIFNIKSERITVLPDGVDLNRFKEEELLDIQDDATQLDDCNRLPPDDELMQAVPDGRPGGFRRTQLLCHLQVAGYIQ